MRTGGRTAVVVFCGLLALALVAGAGAAGKAFAHRDRDRACDCCCGKGGCGDHGAGDCGSRRCQDPCGPGRDAAPCPDCGAGHGKGPMPSMMEGMKGHVDDVRKRVEALRKSEKALSGITDQAAFRAAVLEHLKAVDDLQEAHLRHMESMPAKMRAGEKAGGPMPCAEPCPDCPQAGRPGPPAAK